MTLTQEQLTLIANCVEDCHRFACGQTELWHTTSAFNIKEWDELRDRLQCLQPLVTPELEKGASYGWAYRSTAAGILRACAFIVRFHARHYVNSIATVVTTIVTTHEIGIVFLVHCKPSIPIL